MKYRSAATPANMEVSTKSGIEYRDNSSPAFCLNAEVMPVPMSSDMHVVATKKAMVPK